MTGLDRLRGYARRMDELHVWPGGARLREIADQIEREHDAEAADSPYDAILPEDREAVAWVRERGGLDAVRSEWRSRVPYDKHEETRQRLLDHIAECETALRRRNGRIEELGRRIRDLAAENAELRRRAMPEGCEWPRYESGEPVMFGGFAADVFGTALDEPIFSVELFENGFTLHGDGVQAFYGYEERVRRPAVLAADGEPLEVGQTVWHVTTGHEYTVRSCTNGGAHLSRDGRPAGYCRAEYLTHQRPVLGADGVPIKKGDTVYLLPGEWCDEFPCLGFHGGEELEVFADGEAVHVSGSVQCREKKKVGFRGTCYPQPSQLTHTKPEPPDSWERIEEDALSFVEDNAGIPHDQDQMERDMLAILRRCKALSERGE